MMPAMPWFALPAAVALDLAVGDPQGWPHPVRWMGQAIDALEPRIRRLNVPDVVGGGTMAVGLVIVVWAVTAGVLAAAAAIHPVLGAGLEIVAIGWILSLRSLYEAGAAVRQAFGQGGLAAARRSVAMIVGRETDRLDRTGVSRAAVESVAENLVDGVVSPLFYAALGGAPLAMAYKMVNTLDSMIGYRNARYEQFGKVAARMDDVANWLPARLSVPMIAAAAAALGAPWRRSLTVAIRDGARAASPNAGYPEAAFAGAMGVRLGGGAVYHGSRVDKPHIGGGHPDPAPVDISRACHLMVVSGLLWTLAMTVLQWVA